MKLAGFLAALAVVFGLAVAVGSAIGPEPEAERPASASHGEETMTAMASTGEHGPNEEPARAVRGLAVADGELRLVVATPELTHGQEQSLRFRIVDADERAVRRFDVGHERRMHAIVVRRDLTGFQHLHPRMDADGTWSVPLRLDVPGSYRLYADFAHEGTPRTLATDLRVDGDAALRPLPPAAHGAVSDGGDAVRLGADAPRAGEETTLRFEVTRDGEPVSLAPYLGAGGHLVALREGDLAFLHVHPLDDRAREDGRVAFATTFPSAGRYRLFLQYRHGEQVRTAAFTLEVAP